MRDDITAVMIVKNEEAVLSRCLDSLEGVMPVVLADTGSTDRTMEIARDYGATVYEHPWADSFSEARNWIKEKVPTTWALQIDADEEVPGATVGELDKLDDAHSAYLTPIHNIMTDGSMSLHQFERVYQPKKVHYEWRVHNELVVDEGKVGLSGFSLLHHGYSAAPEELKRKYENTLRLLLMDVEDAGYVMRNIRYLIQTYRSLQRHVDVLAILDEHLSKLRPFPGIYQDAAASAILAYNALGNNAKAKIAGIQLLKLHPEALDALFYLGVAHMEDQSWTMAVDCFIRYVKVRSALQLEGSDSTVVYHTWGNRADAFQNMGICASFLGDRLEAAMFFMQALMLAKHRTDIAGFASNADNSLCLLANQKANPGISLEPVGLITPDWDKQPALTRN